MPTPLLYVALLRGINVGGNNKVPMAKLKAVFEKMGFTNVRTYINSGNVIFGAKKSANEALAASIEKALEKAFGFAIRTVVRDAKTFAALTKAIPKAYANDAEQRTDVLFLWKKYDSKKSLALVKTAPGIDTLSYAPGAIIWHFQRKHYAKSKMHDFIGTELYKNMTARNVNTVRKLAAMLIA